MKSHTIKLLRSLGRFGGIGAAGVAASIAASAVVVKAASSQSCSDTCPAKDNEQRQFHLPEADHPPFRKWHFNWDRMEPGKDNCIWPVTSSASEKDDPKGVPISAFGDSNNNQTKIDDYPTARRNLILIRHGQYNTDGEDDTRHTLTKLGEEQAMFTGKKLKEIRESLGIKFTSITSSTMTRAIQTANIILTNMETETQKDLKLEIKDPLLSEGTPCIPEPPYRKQELWNPPQRDILVDGSRIEAGFRKYFHRAEHSQENESWEIIVCHGNVIRYFSCRALQFPPEGWLRMSIDHCSITRFTILPTGEVILRGLGDSGHIPFEKATVV